MISIYNDSKVLFLTLVLSLMTTALQGQNSNSNKEEKKKGALTVEQFFELSSNQQALYMSKLVPYLEGKYRTKWLNSQDKKALEFADFLRDNYVFVRDKEKLGKNMLEALDFLSISAVTHPNESVAKMFLLHTASQMKEEK